MLKSGLFKKSKTTTIPQTHGDFQLVDSVANVPVNIEVKYDIMAENTGNMCFEFSNGKGKLTGIFATEADLVTYVLNNGDNYTLYIFNKALLKEYLGSDKNIGSVRIVNGGDKKRFTMALSPIENMAKLAINIIEVKRADLQV